MSTSIFDLTTDKLDYAPADWALFTVTGVPVGATVEFQVLHMTDTDGDGVDDAVALGDDGIAGTADDINGQGGGHEAFYVTDGGDDDLDGEANGVIVTNWYVNPDDSADQAFLLTAQEVQAGADGSFRDR